MKALVIGGGIGGITAALCLRAQMDQLATCGPMWPAARLAPSRGGAMQDWLYKVDVTA